MLSGKRAYNLHSVRTSSLKIILRDQAQDSANGFQKFKSNFFLYACFLTHILTSPIVKCLANLRSFVDDINNGLLGTTR